MTQKKPQVIKAGGMMVLLTIPKTKLQVLDLMKKVKNKTSRNGIMNLILDEWIKKNDSIIKEAIVQRRKELENTIDGL